VRPAALPGQDKDLAEVSIARGRMSAFFEIKQLIRKHIGSEVEPESFFNYLIEYCSEETEKSIKVLEDEIKRMKMYNSLITV
jgi:hypothetical protein